MTSVADHFPLDRLVAKIHDFNAQWKKFFVSCDAYMQAKRNYFQHFLLGGMN
jgi:hypothetical protein